MTSPNGATCFASGISNWSEGARPADGVNRSGRIRRNLIAAPRHMAVGPHQHQAALIEGGGLLATDIAYREGNLPLGCRLYERHRIGWRGAEAQQHEPVSEQVKGRLPGRDKGMGRAVAGPRG